MSRILQGPGHRPLGTQDTIFPQRSLSGAAAHLLALAEVEGSAFSRRQLHAITHHDNAQLFWSDLFAFGCEIQGQGEDSLAAAVYFLIKNEAPDPKLRQEAAENLAGVTGQRATTGARLEHLSHRWLNQTADPALLLGMMGAGLAYQGGRSLSFKLLKYWGIQKDFGTWGLRSFSALGGFFFEVPTFIFTERLGRMALGTSLSWEHGPLQEEFLGTALVLGALKFSSFGSRQLLQKIHGMESGLALTPPKRWVSSYPLNAKLLPQGGMLGGILLGQGAERAYFHRESVDGWVNLLDGLATLLQFNGAGRLTPHLAPGLHRWQHHISENIFPKQATSTPASSNPQWALAGGPGAEGQVSSPLGFPLYMMSSNEGPKGGGGGANPPGRKRVHYLYKGKFLDPESYFREIASETKAPEVEIRPSLDRYLVQLPSGSRVRLQENDHFDADANNWTLIEIGYKKLIFSPTQEIGLTNGRRIAVTHGDWKYFKNLQGKQFEFIPYLGPSHGGSGFITLKEAETRIREGNPEAAHLKYLLEMVHEEEGLGIRERLLGFDPTRILSEQYHDPHVVELVHDLHNIGNRHAQLALMGHDYSYFSPEILCESSKFLEAVLLSTGGGAFNGSALALLGEVADWSWLHRQSQQDMHAFSTLMNLGKFQDTAREWVEHWDLPDRMTKKANENWDDLIRLALLVKMISPQSSAHSKYLHALNRVSLKKYFSDFLTRPEYFYGIHLTAVLGHLEALGFLNHATVSPEVFDDLHRRRNLVVPWIELTGNTWMARILAKWSLKQPQLLERLERYLQEDLPFALNVYLDDGANNWSNQMAERIALEIPSKQSVYRAQWIGIQYLAGQRSSLIFENRLNIQELLNGWEVDPVRILALNSFYRTAGNMGWDKIREEIVKTVFSIDLSKLKWDFFHIDSVYQLERTRLALGAMAQMGNLEASDLLVDLMTWDFAQDTNPWLNFMERENLLGVQIILEQAAEGAQGLKFLARLSEAGFDDVFLDKVENHFPWWAHAAYSLNTTLIPILGRWYLNRKSLLALKSLESLAESHSHARLVWQALGYSVSMPFSIPPTLLHQNFLKLVAFAKNDVEMSRFLHELSQDPKNPQGPKWVQLLKLHGPEFEEDS